MYDHSTHEYTVQSTNVDDGTHTTESFDVVFVCNGHFCKTRVPNIAGVDVFQGGRTQACVFMCILAGTQLHSHAYRDPATFAGRTVACIGAGSSGVDIAIELAAVCKQVCGALF